MSTVLRGFAGFPDEARLWVFGAGRPISSEEEARLLGEVDAFLAGWKAHGHQLAAGREWLSGRFLLVAVDETIEPPSGCSIDALVRVLRGLEAALDLPLVGGGDIWMRGADGEIVRLSRPEFKERAAAGEVTEETMVFDLALTRLGELRRGKWELRAGDSWHRRFLPAKG